MSANTISVVTCSVHDGKFNELKQNLAHIFGDNLEIIRINDAKSMAEGYNRGARLANGDILIFCHDDIEILNKGVPEIINSDLENFDIVGAAGTSRLVEGRWHTSGEEYVHGQVAHSCSTSVSEYQICVYGKRSNTHIAKNIQALDGLFIVVRKSVLDSVCFDETFDGFHLYDLDFTFAAYLMGFRIAVDYRIQLLHHSSGRYDQAWKTNFDAFNEKYARLLPTKDDHTKYAIQRFPFHSKKRLLKKMYSFIGLSNYELSQAKEI